MQGLEIIFRVGLAILQYNQTDLIQLDMEAMSQVNSCVLFFLFFPSVFSVHGFHAAAGLAASEMCQVLLCYFCSSAAGRTFLYESVTVTFTGT